MVANRFCADRVICQAYNPVSTPLDKMLSPRLNFLECFRSKLAIYAKKKNTKNLKILSFGVNLYLYPTSPSSQGCSNPSLWKAFKQKSFLSSGRINLKIYTIFWIFNMIFSIGTANDWQFAFCENWKKESKILLKKISKTSKFSDP